jgi:hypothetical protein
MRTRTRLFSSTFMAVAAFAASPAAAAVSLSITDGSGPPTSGTATRGTTFSFALNLVSTAEQTTGLAYFLETNAAGSGLFAIVDRNLAGSTYSDPAAVDAVVEAPASALLDPRNNNNLGASLANVNAANGAGTFLVANYTISVSATAPLGTYTIQTFSATGAGYAGPASSGFANGDFAAPGTYAITVVPEPGTAAGFIGVGLAGLAARRRRVGPMVR